MSVFVTEFRQTYHIQHSNFATIENFYNSVFDFFVLSQINDIIFLEYLKCLVGYLGPIQQKIDPNLLPHKSIKLLV